jgi:hypothetical protein
VLAAVVLAVTVPGLPTAFAAEDGTVVRVQNGTVRCAIVDADASHDRSQVVCGRADGAPFGSSPTSTGKYPQKLSLVVMLETGEKYWQAGTVPGAPDADVVLGTGQARHEDGWTITEEGQHTRIRNDASGRVMIVTDVGAYQV